MIKLIAAIAILLASASPNLAETVDVKYRGPVPLVTFDCPALRASSLVNRICFDDANSYLVVQLRSTYYHYCGMPKNVFDAWIAAGSLGRFYNQNIKGNIYDCRGKTTPAY